MVGPSGSASLFGLAPGGVYQASNVTIGTGALLPHRFTLTAVQRAALLPAAWQQATSGRSARWPGGLFSVALSLGSPPLDVIQHPALWSPDFPPLAMGQERSSDPLRPVILVLRGVNPPLESPRQTGYCVPQLVPPGWRDN